MLVELREGSDKDNLEDNPNPESEEDLRMRMVSYQVFKHLMAV